MYLFWCKSFEIQGLALRCRGKNCCVQCQNPVWALVQVPTASGLFEVTQQMGSEVPSTLSFAFTVFHMQKAAYVQRMQKWREGKPLCEHSCILDQ